jgi:hypothetical protein
MNTQTATKTATKTKTCDRCQAPTTHRGITGLCRACAITARNKSRPTQEVKPRHDDDYEAPHFTETDPYKNYAAAVEGVMTPGEFITIGEMKRRVGELFYRPEWMQDVVKSFEAKGANPVRYGLKETAKEICAKLGHMREMNKPNCPRCGGKV